MIVYKYSRETDALTEYQVPDNWKLPLMSYDMDETINCVRCGKEMTFGKGYTSRTFFNKGGFGYYECEQCYFDALAQERKAAEEND